ncbi:beta-hexosaminidase [Thecamonas trahens ATCC 50062]|uniref:beta-N-acetylhexosaminidase n=1 Tax=Thecamonas trahens ATCC 50062 TaxID=461836 RepID=A0A0L0D9N4_THETB|nr:beta-hexosaminidase [Thecamonas trahens ATCC 50062]KNC48960.1 beta-hexosaminidase [Thecamonas trahens ATCC 50062]|eukprot:XP_013758377.1 beta-hexosaminidase [Thecamonas trahens ATCC 50062]
MPWSPLASRNRTAPQVTSIHLSLSRFELSAPRGPRDGPIVIRGDSVLGLLRGLNALALSTAWVPEVGRHCLALPQLPFAHAPRARWRGFMLDTARHFANLRQVEKLLDAMEVAHLNVFSWHITDAPSWPLELASWPELSRAGAFAPSATYSREAVEHVIAYAHARGIRVVPSIDMPAHVAAIGKAFPEAIVRPFKWEKIDEFGLNLTSPLVTALVTDVIDEVASLFPDTFLHLGGDEVKRSVMSHAEWTAFEDSVVARAVAAGKRPMLWQDALDTGALSRGAIANASAAGARAVVQSWKAWAHLGNAAVRKALAAQVDILVSHGWYLDFVETTIDAYRKSDVLGEAFELAQTAGTLTDAVLGGEMALWTERVDATNFVCRAWPRGLAIADLLWREPAGNATVAMMAAAGGLVATGLPDAAWESRRATGTPGHQCGRIPVDLQRRPGLPHPDAWTVAQLNIDAGGGDELQHLETWVRNHELDVLGLCELNQWEASMGTRAAEMGFPFYHIMPIPSGYHLGIMATRPISVVAELRQPGKPFQRGALHVRIEGIHYVVVHLHAHDAGARLAEVEALTTHLAATLADTAPLVVMGDFNTLSPDDDDGCEYSSSLVSTILSHNWTRLRLKYLNPDHTVAYAPYNKLAQFGLRDLVVHHSACEYTEPTAFGIDQIPPADTTLAPQMRVDYVVARGLDSSAACTIVRTNVTNALSDHFPTVCSLPRSIK